MVAIVLGLFYFAITGGFTVSLQFDMAQRITAGVIGFLITVVAVIIGPRL